MLIIFLMVTVIVIVVLRASVEPVAEIVTGVSSVTQFLVYVVLLELFHCHTGIIAHMD